VYDSKFDRVIISKLDYIPQPGKGVKYNSEKREFYITRTVGTYEIDETVDVTDPEYFCNKSWTLSYNVNSKSWVSFHSYIPNFYIAENNFFYSGLNSCCDDNISLDIIATQVLPPDPTTTTTSTSTSTTSTTTTAAPDCTLEGVTSVADCTLEGIAINIEITCNCYTVTNITSGTQTFSYTQCDGTPVIDQPVLAGNSAYICAKTGTVVVNGDFFNVSGPLGICTVDGECTTSSTTSTSTTICANCKTYTLTNTTDSTKTATQLVDCNTGLLYQRSVPGNTILHVCSCNVPTVPTGLTQEEFGTGCTICFCYDIQNLEGVINYVQYIKCDGTIVDFPGEAVGEYSSIGICAIEGTINAGTMIVTGGVTSCTEAGDCLL